MKILIVEDDFASRLVLQEFLKHYGTVHIAVNGREAVAAAHASLDAAEPYDLVCMDIAMPEMNGHEALKEIRALEAAAGIEAPRGAKVVMTSAFTDKDNVLEALEGHCDYFLAKPIQKTKLLESLRRLGLIA